MFSCRRDYRLYRGLADLLWHDWLWDMATIGEGDQSGAGCGMGNGGRPNMSAKAWHRSCTLLVLVLWWGLFLPHLEMCSLWRDSRMLYILGDMGWSTIGIVWYQLGPGVGTQKVGGDGECMGWS